MNRDGNLEIYALAVMKEQATRVAMQQWRYNWSVLLQMVEAEERQKVVQQLTFNVATDVMERGLVSGVECQHLTQSHLTV